MSWIRRVCSRNSSEESAKSSEDHINSSGSHAKSSEGRSNSSGSRTKSSENRTNSSESRTKSSESNTKSIESTTKTIEQSTKSIESTTKTIEQSTKSIGPRKREPYHRGRLQTNSQNYITKGIQISRFVSLKIIFPTRTESLHEFSSISFSSSENTGKPF